MRRRARRGQFWFGSLALAAASACSPGGGMDVPADAPATDPLRFEADRPRSLLAVSPIPAADDLDPERVDLGRRLFEDPALSRDGTIACASCHDLDLGGADGRRFSIGVGGAAGSIHAPTVLNARFNFRQFWDGRAATLEEQAEVPLRHLGEMGSEWPAILAYLAGNPEYARDFAAAYPSGIRRESVVDAIAEYERSLVTPDCAFDQYLRGDAEALSPRGLAGWNLFQEIGCVACHQGVNLGGNSFQNVGVAGDYFADRGGETAADQGRFNATGLERDRHRFKVPTLRNVALTAPYLHDGSVATLDECIQVMARYQLGIELAGTEVLQIVEFLNSLTGRLPPAGPGERLIASGSTPRGDAARAK